MKHHQKRKRWYEAGPLMCLVLGLAAYPMACENIKTLEPKSTDNVDTDNSNVETEDTESGTVTQTNTGHDTDTDTGTESSADTDTGTQTGLDTNSETDTWFDTGFEDPSCPADQWSACYDNDVWCMDAQGNPLSMIQDCTPKERCKPGSPATCECTIDVNVIRAYQQCGADGNVHWFDSCGVEGELFAFCGDQQCAFGCQNTTTETAACVTLNDGTPCELLTNPDRSYDICVAGICVSPGCGDASCNVRGPHFPLADTNQRECYNDSGPMICPNPGEDFYGQDAQYGWDAIYPANQRYTRTTPVSDQPVVKDNVTGLEWQGCRAGLSGSDCETFEDWIYCGWSEAIAYCDSLAWGGQTDWRVPDVYEFLSILDNGTHDSAVDPAVFPSAPYYSWCSSSQADDSEYGHVIDLLYGGVEFQNKIWGDPLEVQCVRGGPGANTKTEPRFVRDLSMPTQPTVSDQVTGLWWQGCSAGLAGKMCETGSAEAYTWHKALAYCEGLSYGGHSDWRLPNRAELQSIVDYRLYSPAIDPVAFPATLSDYFCSSSSNVRDSSLAWNVSLEDGAPYKKDKSDSNLVRCVRGGT